MSDLVPLFKYKKATRKSIPFSFYYNLIKKDVISISYNLMKNIKQLTNQLYLENKRKIEFNEKVKFTLHNMNARAETRALKRAIETLFGSVINYFVMHNLGGR